MTEQPPSQNPRTQSSRPPRRHLLAIAALVSLVPLTVAGAAGTRRLYNAFVARRLRGRRVYDTSGNGERVIEAALQRAAAEGKHVLVVLGGDWCQWCLLLDDVFSSHEEIRALLEERYVVAKLDAGANEALVESWGNPTAEGVPVLVFLDEAGRVAAVRETASLETFGGRVLDFDERKLLDALERADGS
ncbi:MAG TPA: thioredoxin family protein [Polyangiaceae bacterium]|nr:thioredoxin family protein [Polyangiaceae bacterium]